MKTKRKMKGMTMMKTIFALAGVLCFGAFAVEAHDHDHAGHGPAAKGVKAVTVARMSAAESSSSAAAEKMPSTNAAP